MAITTRPVSKVCVELDEATAKKFRVWLAQNGMTVSDFIRAAIEKKIGE